MQSIGKLAKITRKCRKLYIGSGFASATWGHQASGFSDTDIIQLERDALALACAQQPAAPHCPNGGTAPS